MIPITFQLLSKVFDVLRGQFARSLRLSMTSRLYVQLVHRECEICKELYAQKILLIALQLVHQEYAGQYITNISCILLEQVDKVSPKHEILQYKNQHNVTMCIEFGGV